MNYALTDAQTSQPMYLDQENYLTYDGDGVLPYTRNTVNEIAEDLIVNKSFDYPRSLLKLRVSKTKNELFSDANVKLIEEQDYSHNTRLISTTNYKNFQTIVERFIALLYLESAEIKRTDELSQRLLLVQIDKDEAKGLKIGQNIVLCAKLNTIYQNLPYYKVVDTVNIEKLFENRKIDTDLYDYFVVEKKG